jgi:DNA-binding GntR family transcriptional regulator
VELQRSDPLYRQVYRLLRQQILDGKYAPGETVQESRTAETLKVSRTPVREALRQLEREGLLVPHGTELVVADPSQEEFVDLYTCRAALERLVAERAALLATPSEIEAMDGALEAARAASVAGDAAGVFDANTRFHDVMVKSTRMPSLHQLMDTIRGRILVARRRVLSYSKETQDDIYREHCVLLDAIRRRDVQAAQECMEAHMRNDIERGREIFEKQARGE